MWLCAARNATQGKQCLYKYSDIEMSKFSKRRRQKGNVCQRSTTNPSGCCADHLDNSRATVPDAAMTSQNIHAALVASDDSMLDNMYSATEVEANSDLTDIDDEAQTLAPHETIVYSNRGSFSG